MKQKSQQPNDDFGAFLWSMQSQNRQGDTPQTPFEIMRAISRSDFARVEQVLSETRVRWNEFTEGLKYLQEAGLVRMTDDDNGSLLYLTEEGHQWALVMLEENDEEP